MVLEKKDFGAKSVKIDEAVKVAVPKSRRVCVMCYVTMCNVIALCCLSLTFYHFMRCNAMQTDVSRGTDNIFLWSV